MFLVTLKVKLDDELNPIFKKVQEAVHKNGIRTTEFFRDHDKLRKGIITENQFVCGLMLCAGKEAHLTRGEVQKLVDFYKDSEGRVAYKEFCDKMENGELFLTTNRCKKSAQCRT